MYNAIAETYIYLQCYIVPRSNKLFHKLFFEAQLLVTKGDRFWLGTVATLRPITIVYTVNNALLVAVPSTDHRGQQ